MVIFYRRIVLIVISVLVAVSAYFFVVYNSQKCYYKFRCLQHCNMDNFPVGVEGTGNFSKKLHFVYAIVRHGDRFTRTPNLFKGDSLRGDCRREGLEDEKKAYELFLELGNHLGRYNITGARYLNEALVDNTVGDCSESQLTPRGYFQAYLLGKYFSQRYFVGSDALTAEFTDIVVRSSNYNRTVQTALTIISALLNNSGMKFNEVNLEFEVVGDSTGFLMNDYLDRTLLGCSRLLEKYRNIDYSKLLIPYEQFTNLYPKLRMLLNMSYSIENFKIVDLIMDYINVQFCHPEYAVSEYLHKLSCSDRVLLISMADELLYFTYYTLGSEDITLPLFGRLFNIIEGSVKQNYKSFYLDATHDTTMAALLIALKLPRKYWPPYIARLVFEIYFDNSNLMFIRILYNGNDITCESQYCSADCRIHGNSCTYHTFRNLFLKGSTLEETWKQFVRHKC